MAEEQSFNDAVNKLRQTRDELRVQLDLGKKEARQSWEVLEQRFERLEASLRRIGSHGGETLESIGDDIKGLIRDIRAEFERIRGYGST